MSKQSPKAKPAGTRKRVTRPVMIVEQVLPTRGSPAPSTPTGATPIAAPAAASRPDVARMNAYLRGERALVEAYDLAIKDVQDPEAKAALQEIRLAHAEHARMLTDRIVAYGGTPAKGAGAAGAFARAMQRGADLFGDRTALAALEEDEKHLLNEYKKSLTGLSEPTRELVLTVMRPELLQTRDLVRALEEFLRSPK